MIENILAVLLLTTGLIGGLLALQNSTLYTVNSDLSSIATQLANEKIEAILADKEYLGYEYLSADDNYPAELKDELNGFERSVNIVEVNADDLMTPQEGSGIKRVDVVVTWGTEEYQTVSVTTLVSDYM